MRRGLIFSISHSILECSKEIPVKGRNRELKLSLEGKSA